MYEALIAGIKESGRLWNDSCALYHAAMKEGVRWPSEEKLRSSLKKGNYALHSQTVQAVIRNCKTAFHNIKSLKKQFPHKNHHYPKGDEHQYPLLWPAQAVKIKDNRLVLPMGKGRLNLSLHTRLNFPFEIGAVKIVWKDGWELHITGESPDVGEAPGNGKATCDLGEIHQAALVTDQAKALVVSGRGIRTIKRQRQMALGQISRKRSRCQKGSRRYRKLQKARRKISSRTKRRIRDLRHKGLRKAVDWLVENKVGSLYIGNPDGVKRKRCGRHHNDRLAKWEYGADINLLKDKCSKARISAFDGTERGTSSHCPVCGKKKRPTGRNFACECGCRLHRDVMGGANMHPMAFGTVAPVPLSKDITYLRPWNTRCSSSPDTGLCCLSTRQGRSASSQGKLSSRKPPQKPSPFTE